MPLIGYADRLSVRPGEKIRFMISCDFRNYRADTVRMIHADDNKMGPGFKVEPLKSSISGTYKGKRQRYRQGSYVLVPSVHGLSHGSGFTFTAWVMPTTPSKGLQGLITSRDGKKGVGLFINRAGAAAFGIRDGSGRTRWLAARKPMLSSTWYFLACSMDLATGKASVWQVPVVRRPSEDEAVISGKLSHPSDKEGVPGAFLIGAFSESGGNDGDAPMGHFNGKIDRPRAFARALGRNELEALRDGASPHTPGMELAADWDFSQRVDSDLVIDNSEFQSHGRAVNSPKRAVTGYNWTGLEVDFKRAPAEYGAIHFHADDLEDCGWTADIEYEIPRGTKSAIYALRVRAEGHEDYVPYFVLPPVGKPASRIAFLAPTLSYLAYGNDHFISDPELQRRLVMPKNFRYPVTRIDRYLVKTNLLSLYDKHKDKSGVCYVSRLRPILTMRPDYREAVQASGNGAPHQFSADLWITDWMEAKGFGHDIITDEDLHNEGLGLIRQYKVIVTGTHPEYWTAQMLDSMDRYLNDGGRLMYMGGNGFYWVTSINGSKPHVVEVRRWGGTQTWTSEPGEYYHSSTGEMGGLWRNRNRAPQKMLGIGFTSQGHGPNRAYQRLPDSFDPRAAFIFEGIGEEEVIGDFDCLDQGPRAAGYEFDRFDHSLGTPADALLLASAMGFSDSYQHVIEEVDSADSKQGGSVEERVRADMVYFDYPHDGAVFSTGSVSWSGCLFFNKYNNNVSRITENVLRAFAEKDSLYPGKKPPKKS